MKIGLLSDIHGDIDHLRQALKLLSSHQVNHILCCGDLTDGEPYVDDVVRELLAHNVQCVSGNHDQLTFYEQADLAANTPDSPELLQSETRAYLANLPRGLWLEFEGRSLSLIHATPWDNSIHVFSYSSRQLQQQVIAQAKADCVIFGHTHEPCQAYLDGVWLFNPGSVYLNRFEDTHTCAILSLPDFDYSVYDITTGLSQRIPYIT
jgi:putative phosphoesterase